MKQDMAGPVMKLKQFLSKHEIERLLGYDRPWNYLTSVKYLKIVRSLFRPRSLLEKLGILSKARLQQFHIDRYVWGMLPNFVCWVIFPVLNSKTGML